MIPSYLRKIERDSNGNITCFTEICCELLMDTRVKELKELLGNEAKVVPFSNRQEIDIYPIKVPVEWVEGFLNE